MGFINNIYALLAIIVAGIFIIICVIIITIFLKNKNINIKGIKILENTDEEIDKYIMTADKIYYLFDQYENIVNKINYIKYGIIQEQMNYVERITTILIFKMLKVVNNYSIKMQNEFSFVIIEFIIKNVEKRVTDVMRRFCRENNFVMKEGTEWEEYKRQQEDYILSIAESTFFYYKDIFIVMEQDVTQIIEACKINWKEIFHENMNIIFDKIKEISILKTEKIKILENKKNVIKYGKRFNN